MKSIQLAGVVAYGVGGEKIITKKIHRRFLHSHAHTRRKRQNAFHVHNAGVVLVAF